MIVPQGLRGKPIADLCTEHQISQAQYYQWRDQFLAGADRVVNSDPKKKQLRLEHEVVRIKLLVGELSVKLKKNRKRFEKTRMRRRPSCLVATRNEFLVERIKALKADHPIWGFRRLWAQLKYDENLPVNKKRILRLLRQHALLVEPNQRLKAKRTPLRSKPRGVRPNDR